MSRLRFGPFAADPASGELLRDGQRVPLQDLPFRFLVALLERPGEVVTRVELAERLWGKGTHVDAAAGLHTAVAKLREALGDTAEAPRLVETLPRRGYRFLGSVLPAGGEAEAAGDGAGAAGNEEGAAGAAGAEAGAAGAMEGAAPSLAAAGEEGRSAARRRPRGAAIALVALALALAAGWWAATRPAEHRVAVILFDDETGLPGGARRAQALTDATVERLTREADLAVIGNAAVLRTARPFRDLLAIRDALDADLLVVGQLQQLDGGTVVRAHLIRGDDQAHVWFATIPFRAAGEAAFQREVADHIAAAVRAEVDG